MDIQNHIKEHAALGGVPALDSNGNLVANILPRTNTQANLKTLVSGGGELASATDAGQPAIVQLNGASGSGTAAVYSPMATGHWDEVNSNFCASTGTWNVANQRFDYSADNAIQFQAFGYGLGLNFTNSVSLNPALASQGGAEMVFGVESATGIFPGNGFTFSVGNGGAGQQSGTFTITDQLYSVNVFQAKINAAGLPALGFYNHNPVAKPTVTGSKASGAALTSLLAALVSVGLITDSTTS
jgi:hypothetical protein